MRKKINRRNYTVAEALRAVERTHRHISVHHGKHEDTIYIYVKRKFEGVGTKELCYDATVTYCGLRNQVTLDFGECKLEPDQTFYYKIEYIERFLRRYTGKDLEVVVKLTIIEKGDKNGS